MELSFLKGLIACGFFQGLWLPLPQTSGWRAEFFFLLVDGFRVTGWPVDRLGRSRCGTTDDPSGSGLRWGSVSFVGPKTGGKSLRCKCAQAFYGSKPATVEPFAGRVVFCLFFLCFFCLPYRWKNVLTRRINVVYWWGTCFEGQHTLLLQKQLLLQAESYMSLPCSFKVDLSISGFHAHLACVGLCGAQSIVESPLPHSGTSRHQCDVNVT